jgi:hypothetical protein
MMAADDKKPAAPSKPLVQLTPEKKARIARKTAKLEERKFDAPDEAMEFYANRRTGPIVTRGNNITTGARPLNRAAYLAANEALKSMPRFSTATRSLLPPDGGASLSAPSPGAALGTWVPLGPANQGGRTRALLIHPTTPTTMYAGGVDGGVWKTTDGGGTWSTTTDLQMTNLAVVALAFKPTDTNTIYAGTGEGFGNADAIRGAGIFRSTDGGLNWAQLPSTNTTDFLYTMKILVSPRKPNRIWASTRTGIFRSLDGGGTWSLVQAAGASGGCTDMAMQVNRTTGYVFASCGRTTGQGTIYRALDSDSSTFTSIMSLTGQGRSSIAVAPSNESIIYVMSSQRSAGGGPGQYGLHGVYRSTANGNPGSFTTQRQGNIAPGNTATKINQLLLSNPVIALLTECGFGTSSFANQGWYDNVIAVDPVDSNKVWTGGIDLWRSDDGGVNWGTASFWWFDKGVDPEYSHADQHAIVFHPNYNGSSNKVLFVASDGGIARLDDALAPVNTALAAICGSPVANGPAWVDRNNNYTTTQFYDGAVYPDGNTFFGGLQDNGTLRGTTASTNWTVLAGGDGGYAAVDIKADTNPSNDVLFLENTANSLKKSTNGGATFADANVGITGIGFQFITPFVMNQTTKSQLWIGGFDIWRTVDQAVSWSRATGANGTCGLGSISAFATHPLDGNRVIVGMSDGCTHYNTAALSAPNTGNWPGGAALVSGNISWMAWDPNNVNVAYLTVSGFITNTVFKSTDAGATWSPLMGSGLTALPQVPATTVVVNPADSQQIFVGTDIGVFTTIDGGTNWYRENTGFANVSVESLKINETPPYKLFAFTHGRGAWMTPIATTVPPATVTSKGSPVTANR